MKFWQLVTICYPIRSSLEQLLEEPEWAVFLKWLKDFNQHVRSQNRAILDAVLPEQLVVSAMTLCRYRFCIRNGILILCHEESGEPIATVEVYLRYGAEAIDEVLEKGSFKVPSASK
jgi:hypothetical protein